MLGSWPTLSGEGGEGEGAGVVVEQAVPDIKLGTSAPTLVETELVTSVGPAIPRSAGAGIAEKASKPVVVLVSTFSAGWELSWVRDRNMFAAVSMPSNVGQSIEVGEQF